MYPEKFKRDNIIAPFSTFRFHCHSSVSVNIGNRCWLLLVMVIGGRPPSEQPPRANVFNKSKA